MRHLDASAVIDLWDNYPILQFKSVWDWFCDEFSQGNVAISLVALEETGKKAPDCERHLKRSGVSGIEPTTTDLAFALLIKHELGIEGEAWGIGVGEEDLLIISVAKNAGVELVTNEARQPNLPKSTIKYKIPAVCAIPLVHVRTLRLIDLIKESGRSFG